MIKPETLKNLRKAKSLTQSALGKMAGVSAVSINYYEMGKRQPDQSTLEALARALGSSVKELTQNNAREIADDGLEMLKLQLELMTKERDFWRQKVQEFLKAHSLS